MDTNEQSISPSGVPESVTAEALQKLMETKATEAKDAEERKSRKSKYEDLTDIPKDELYKTIADCLDEMVALCNTPVIHKLAVLMILNNFVEWHTTVGSMALKDKDNDSAVSWLRDAGKFQSMITTLLGIQLGDDDQFTE